MSENNKENMKSTRFVIIDSEDVRKLLDILNSDITFYSMADFRWLLEIKEKLVFVLPEKKEDVCYLVTSTLDMGEKLTGSES